MSNRYDNLERIYNSFDIGSVLIKGGTALFIIVVLLVGFYPSINKTINERTVTAVVTDKTVKNDDGDGKYLIYTKTKEGNVQVFEITDSLFKGRFNSSDLYATIEKDKTYEFTVCGNRQHFLSLYPNIYEAIEVKE